MLSERIATRAAAHGLVITDTATTLLNTYLGELARWNRRVNLTAIAFDPILSDAGLDKLVIEPLMATTLLGARPRRWFDLGSGGGSPAIPLRVVWRAGSLTMVESRERKGVFLRDVSRNLGLAHTVVETMRFEELAPLSDADLVTVRAVRLDLASVDTIDSLLNQSGLVMTFGGSIRDDRFVLERSTFLPDGSTLHLYRRN